MSVEVVANAVESIRGRSDECWFLGKRPEELVRSAEEVLGFSFPPGFRLFVSELGAGSLGAEEIFGVTSADFVDSAVPNGVWLTLDARAAWGLPDWMFVVYFDGGVDYYVLDCSVEDSGLFLWRPGVTSGGDELEVVASGFAEFLETLIERELS